MQPGPTAGGTLPPISTLLLPVERYRVDAAGEGVYRALHRDSLEHVMRDVQERPIGGVVLSVARCGAIDLPSVARLVREFPRIPAVALLSDLDPDTARAVLALGQSGVRALVDVRQPDGWRELRRLLVVDGAADIERLVLGQLAIDLAGVPEDCWRFFETVASTGTRTATVRALARRLQVLPSTLMSRFFRAGLPSPKRYLAAARLIYAARMFENPGLSVANVANNLDYSSPQSFGRHVRTLLRMTALDFRQRYDGEGMLQRFREELILPYRGELRAFRPLAVQPRWVSLGRASPGAPASGPVPIRT